MAKTAKKTAIEENLESAALAARSEIEKFRKIKVKFSGKELMYAVPTIERCYTLCSVLGIASLTDDTLDMDTRRDMMVMIDSNFAKKVVLQPSPDRVDFLEKKIVTVSDSQRIAYKKAFLNSIFKQDESDIEKEIFTDEMVNAVTIFELRGALGNFFRYTTLVQLQTE